MLRDGLKRDFHRAGGRRWILLGGGGAMAKLQYTCVMGRLKIALQLSGGRVHSAAEAKASAAKLEL